MPQRTPDITAHLPYLRRYARALTGSQTRGDQYVRLCLEAILEDPGILGEKPEGRTPLYKAFHAVWRRVRVEDENAEPPAGGLDEYLRELPPLDRQLLLLTAIEGFSPAEAGDILSVGEEDAEALLVQARKKLNNQTATRVLVIEDEPIIALDIAGIVTEMGHSVIGTAAIKDDAVAMARSRRPGIVLADIKLGDGSSGIDAASDILDLMDIPVIFVTAYPERLLTGERKEPTYLVTKPF